MIETSGHLVISLYGELCCIFNKIMVVVIVRLDHRGFWLICIQDANQPSCYEPIVVLLLKTIGLCDAGPVTCFVAITLCGTLCVSLELATYIGKMHHVMNSHIR